jgi:hypothetical protein
MPKDKADPAARRARDEAGYIPSFEAVINSAGNIMPGYHKPVAYRFPPQNHFQVLVRQGNGNTVQDHLTGTYNAQVVERSKIVYSITISHCLFRTVKVPLYPKACHKQLPLHLWPKSTLKGQKQQKYCMFSS